VEGGAGGSRGKKGSVASQESGEKQKEEGGDPKVNHPHGLNLPARWNVGGKRKVNTKSIRPRGKRKGKRSREGELNNNTVHYDKRDLISIGSLGGKNLEGWFPMMVTPFHQRKGERELRWNWGKLGNAVRYGKILGRK